MDQFYFEQGYLAAGYFTVIREAEANITSAFTPSFTVNIADTTGYYIPDYIQEDYFLGGVVQEADAILNSEFQQSATVGAIRTTDSQMSAQFTSTATISHIEGADLFAFAEAQLAAAVEAIRDYNIASSAQFDIATDGRVFRDVESAEFSLFDLAVEAKRSRDADLNAEAAFSLSCVPLRIPANTEADASVVVTATANIQGDRVRFSDATVEAQSELTALISHIEGADILLLPFAELSVDANFIADISDNLASEFDLTSVGGYLVDPLIDFNLYASLFASRLLGSGRPRNLEADPSYTLAQIKSSDNPKFGTSCLVIQNGNDDLFNTPADLSYNIPQDEDFVISFSVRGEYIPTGRAPCLISYGRKTNQLNSTSDTNSPFVWGVGAADTGRLEFRYRDSSNNLRIVRSSDTQLGISPSEWTYIAVARVNGFIRMYRNSRAAVGLAGTLGIAYSGAYRSAALEDSKIHLNNPAETGLDINDSLFFDAITYRIGNSSTTGLSSPPDDSEFTKFIYNFEGSTLSEFLSDNTAVITHQGQASLLSQTVLTSSLSGPVKLDPTVLASQFTADIIANKTGEIELTAFSNGTLTVSPGILFDQTASLTASAEATIDGLRIKSLASNSLSTSALSSEINVEFDYSADLISISALTADSSGSTITLSIVAESFAELSAEGVRIQSSAVELDSSTDLTVLGGLTADASSQLHLESELEGTALRIQQLNSQFDSVSAQITVIAKIAQGIVFKDTAAQLTVEPNKITSTDIIGSATANMPVVLGQRFRSTPAVLASESQLISITRVDYQLTQTLSADFALSTAANVLHTDLHVYVIPRENRQFTIIKEQRQFSIFGENRTYRVRR